MPRSIRCFPVRRLIQAGSLALFCWLLWRTVWPLAEGFLPVDAFARLDPLTGLGVPLASRTWTPRLLPAVLLLAVTPVFGRFFCGYLCPMGTTLDLGGALARYGQALPASRPAPHPLPPSLKYALLAGMLTAAACGVNLLFWGSPTALATRLYALAVHPLGLLVGKESLELAKPLAEKAGPAFMSYTVLTERSYDGLIFILVFFLALIGLERIRPRFWCRYLCPAGAWFGLASRLPFWRRTTRGCTQCGACFQACPTGALTDSGRSARHRECLTCLACVHACPLDRASFRFARPSLFSGTHFKTKYEGTSTHSASQDVSAPGLALSRRLFLGGTGAGLALATAHHALPGFALGITAAGEAPIRPPGSVPEHTFPSQCIRCGQCMKACPTNTLQPALDWGAGALFSPVVTAGTGPCEPECNACGQVCPTQAILALPMASRHAAKIGTATVLQDRCLAWKDGKACVVCQEVCPYGAVELRVASTGPPVPVVMEDRCFGCGYCEYHCPVRAPAIVVTARGALRLHRDEYVQAAREAGLSLSPGAHGAAPVLPADIPEGQLPPGFSD